MKNIKYILLVLLFGNTSYNATAQNNSFSQYHLSPVFTSPAEIGTTDYFQVLAHYRKQSLSQGQGYEKLALSAIYPLFRKDGGQRFGGVGIGIMNESSGMNGLLNETSLNAGYAYNLQVNNSNFISFGIQGGYYRRSLDIGEITTDGQYQNGVYDPGLYVGENFSDNVSQTFKADIGATWTVMDAYGEQKIVLGVSTFNVTRANYEFLESSSKNAAPIQYQVYGSIKVFEMDKLHIIPTFRYRMERNYSQLNVGSLFLYELKEGAKVQESHIGLGAWYSHNNAVIFSLEFIQPDYVLSLSYDLPASSNIDKMQVNNAVEATFGWRINRSGKG